ncbi:DUF4286 family protein [Pleomorphovibrio marinus]|uniref:DUF4286 family protein n=1 Tax=Pleomorphovibrio marinus TaxID=2164132 RepID=UPI000E0C9164|nr:DUF4286 family protein [Pleomorphovibrio marinus]
MILYNITISISPENETDFISWMKQHYIPKALKSGCFYEHRFLRLLHHEPGEGVNFSVQFHTRSMAEMKTFEAECARELRVLLEKKFGEQFVSFRSLLESVD